MTVVPTATGGMLLPEKAPRAWRFFTAWALAAHALHLAFPTHVPSTFLLALAVLVGSVVHSLLWNQQYDLLLDALTHWAPLLLWVTGARAPEMRVGPLVALVGIYVAVHARHVDKVVEWYRRPGDYLVGDVARDVTEGARPLTPTAPPVVQ